jgi:hypothetical protein
MPEAVIRGVCVNYENIGNRGPFVALAPGSRTVRRWDIGSGGPLKRQAMKICWTTVVTRGRVWPKTD